MNSKSKVLISGLTEIGRSKEVTPNIPRILKILEPKRLPSANLYLS